MTEIGYDLKVDGTVTARQASRAGEAVVLGSDGLIPADLLPATSGGAKYIYIGKTGGLAQKVVVAGAEQSSASSTMSEAKDSSTAFGLIKMHIKDGYVITSSGEEAYVWDSQLTRPEHYKMKIKNISVDTYRSIVESMPGVQCIGNITAEYTIVGRRSNKSIICRGIVQVQGGQATVISCIPDMFSSKIYGNSDGTFDFGVSITRDSIEPLDR